VERDGGFDRPTIVIVKHLTLRHRVSRSQDASAASPPIDLTFGGVIASNRPFDAVTAEVGDLSSNASPRPVSMPMPDRFWQSARICA
jgi:hypothetical protein